MIDVLGMPNATTQFFPAFLVFFLEAIVVPKILHPLGHKPIAGTAFCALRNTPALGLFATYTLVGSKSKVKVPRSAQL